MRGAQTLWLGDRISLAHSHTLFLWKEVGCIHLICEIIDIHYICKKMLNFGNAHSLHVTLFQHTPQLTDTRTSHTSSDTLTRYVFRYTLHSLYVCGVISKGGLAAKVQLSSSCAALFVTKQRGQAVSTRSPHSFPAAQIISDIKRKCIFQPAELFPRLLISGPPKGQSIIGSCICQTSSGDFSAKLEREWGAEVHSLNGFTKPACLVFRGSA